MNTDKQNADAKVSGYQPVGGKMPPPPGPQATSVAQELTRSQIGRVAGGCMDTPTYKYFMSCIDWELRTILAQAAPSAAPVQGLDVAEIAKAAWDEAWRIAFNEGMSAGHPLGRSYLDCDTEWADSEVVARLAQAAPPAAPTNQQISDYLNGLDATQRAIIEREARAIAPPAAPVQDRGDIADAVSKAMNRAWQLGQTYWQQADSDSYSQNRKSSETQAKFNALVDETRAALLAAPPPLTAEQIQDYEEAAVIAASDAPPAAEAAPATGESGAKPDARDWLLDVMGDWDFTIPTGAFDKIVDYIVATPPAAEAASQPGEMGAGVQVDDKQTMFIVRKPGLVPRLGHPLGDLAASLREWYEGNPGAEIDLLRVWGTSVGTASIEDGREWIFDPEAYKAYKAAASAQQDERKCTCGSGPGGGHSRTCQMFDESMMRYDPFGLAAQHDEREAPPFTGHWRGGNGVISCGTLRIFSENFDTNPADHIKAAIVKWVCDTLNAAQKGQQVQGGGEDKRDAERWRKAIRYIGARYTENGSEVFCVSQMLVALAGFSLMKGSVAEHFTKAIDAALSREQPQGDSNG